MQLSLCPCYEMAVTFLRTSPGPQKSAFNAHAREEGHL